MTKPTITLKKPTITIKPKVQIYKKPVKPSPRSEFIKLATTRPKAP